jgi:S-(hydroxymethyl)glutathione dehydrogenase/alcohol dehydrogenase
MVRLWQAGDLKLDAMVTARRPLEQVNEAFADLENGVGIRTVLEIGH